MTISGADSANYYLSAITGAGTASITPVQIDVSGLLAEDKIFDGTTAAFSDTSLITNSFFPADNVSISSIDAIFSDPAIGDKKTVTVSSISDAGNYVFNPTFCRYRCTFHCKVLSIKRTIRQINFPVAK